MRDGKAHLLPDLTCLHLKFLDASKTTITAVVQKRLHVHSAIAIQRGFIRATCAPLRTFPG